MKVVYQHHSAAVEKVQSAQVPDKAAKGVPTEGAALWTAFVQGDESAYAQLYKHYFHELYDYGVKLCQQPDLVKDCIHDLFIDLWKSRRKKSRVVAIRPYLFKALRNVILKAKTRTSLFLSVELAHRTEQAPSPEATLIHHQASQEQQQRLHEALTLLTQRQREVIFLKFYSQLSYDEVASVMSISTKATYKLMSRAITLLRQKIVPLTLMAIFLS